MSVRQLFGFMRERYETGGFVCCNRLRDTQRFRLNGTVGTPCLWASITLKKEKSVGSRQEVSERLQEAG